MSQDFDHDHHFTGYQKAQYDSLNAKGRRYYDELRWYVAHDHETAWFAAYSEHGLKKSILLGPDNLEALAQLGTVVFD